MTSPSSDASQDTLRDKQLDSTGELIGLSTALAADILRTGPLQLSEIQHVKSRQAGALSLLKDQALRGAISLMLSAGLAGGMNFVFWSVTTHRHDASAVGIISAEVSSITFLAGVCSLNLVTIFGRFLPVAGWRARRLIVQSYCTVCLFGLIFSAIFLLTPFSKNLIIGGEVGRLAFVACVILNGLFNIQDGGLIGFGRFGWVPIENFSVALARLALLPAAALFISAGASVLLSWALPMAIAVVVVNILVIGPLAGRKKTEQPDLPNYGKLGRMVAAGSASNAVNVAVIAFLPALVTHQLGSRQGGYFYVPWTVTTMVMLLMNNITISMVREIVANPNKARSAIRRSVGLAAIVAILVMLVCWFAGGLVLAPLGPNFVSRGVPLLRWAGFAMPATVVIVLFWSLCSIRQRLVPAFAINLVASVCIVSGVLLLKSGTGISRVGIIYCVVEWSAAAIVALPTLRGFLAVARNEQGKSLVETRTTGKEGS